MKYINEWKETGSRDEFVKLLLQKYPHLNQKTAVRRYYDVRKNVADSSYPKVSPTPFYFTEDEEPIVPDRFKLLMIEDMNRYKTKITIPILKKYGFSVSEIHWLVKNNRVKIEQG